MKIAVEYLRRGTVENHTAITLCAAGVTLIDIQRPRNRLRTSNRIVPRY